MQIRILLFDLVPYVALTDCRVKTTTDRRWARGRLPQVFSEENDMDPLAIWISLHYWSTGSDHRRGDDGFET